MTLEVVLALVVIPLVAGAAWLGYSSASVSAVVIVIGSLTLPVAVVQWLNGDELRFLGVAIALLGFACIAAAVVAARIAQHRKRYS